MDRNAIDLCTDDRCPHLYHQSYATEPSFSADSTRRLRRYRLNQSSCSSTHVALPRQWSTDIVRDCLSVCPCASPRGAFVIVGRAGCGHAASVLSEDVPVIDGDASAKTLC